MRYKFYREHKYLSYKLFTLEGLVAKTDFKNIEAVKNVKSELSSLKAVMNGHAAYEDNTLHELLRQKGSRAHELSEDDHEKLEGRLKAFHKALDKIISTKDKEEQLALGYSFYLEYRLFVSESLQHLHEEETIVMNELQRLYSDDELRSVEFNAYTHMSTVQMINMIEDLFPHMNFNECEDFLTDMKKSHPQKFTEILKNIAPKIVTTEQAERIVALLG